MDQDKNAGVVFLMWLLPFEKIYVTDAKILGLDEITLRILSARHQHWSERRARDGTRWAARQRDGASVWAGLSD